MIALNALEKDGQAVGLRQNAAVALIIAIALIGLYAPTSINGTIIAALVPAYVCGLCALLVLYGLVQGAIRSNVYFGLMLLGLLSFFTATSPLPMYAFGAFFPYLGVCCVLLVDLRLPEVKRFKLVLLMVSLPMLALGWATVLGIEEIVSIQESWYQMTREDMFESLVGWFAKPVAVFGTHSVAAFVYFAMCILLLRFGKFASSASDRWLAAILFVAFAGLLPMLLSTSAFALFGILVLILLLRVLKKFSWQTNLLLVFFSILAFLYLLFSGHLGIDLLSEDALDVLTSKGNGFSGRFAQGSRLEPTYNYLFRNYFLPVGATYDEIIEFGDGFIGEYILRTSVLGYLLVWVMLVKFLKRTVFEKRELLLFMLYFLIADFGYPLLTTFRAAFVLPLFMVLWRSLGAKPSSADVVKASV